MENEKREKKRSIENDPMKYPQYCWPAIDNIKASKRGERMTFNRIEYLTSLGCVSTQFSK